MFITNNHVDDRKRLEDWRIKDYEPLTPPDILQLEFHVSEQGHKNIIEARDGICKILKGNDDLIIIVIGPCSIHDLNTAYEYCDRLHEVSQKLKRIF